MCDTATGWYWKLELWIAPPNTEYRITLTTLLANATHFLPSAYSDTQPGLRLTPISNPAASYFDVRMDRVAGGNCLTYSTWTFAEPESNFVLASGTTVDPNVAAINTPYNMFTHDMSGTQDNLVYNPVVTGLAGCVIPNTAGLPPNPASGFVVEFVTHQALTPGTYVRTNDILCIRAVADNSYVKEGGAGKLDTGDTNPMGALQFVVEEMRNPGSNGAIRLRELNTGRHIMFNTGVDVGLVAGAGAAPEFNLWPGGTPFPFEYVNSLFAIEFGGESWRNGTPVTLGPVFAVDQSRYYFEYKGAIVADIAVGHVLCLRSAGDNGFVKEGAGSTLVVGDTNVSGALQFVVRGVWNVEQRVSLYLEVVGAPNRHLQFNVSNVTMTAAAGTPPELYAWPRPNFSADDEVPLKYGIANTFSLQMAPSGEAWQKTAGVGSAINTTTMWYDQTMFFAEFKQFSASPPPTVTPTPTPAPVAPSFVSAATFNASLSPGVNIGITPGVYKIEQQDFAAIKALGFKSVRLPLPIFRDVDYFVSGPTVTLSPTLLALFQQWTDWATQEGLWVVKSVKWFKDAALTDDFPDVSLDQMWTALAAAWVGDPATVGWEVMNEPFGAQDAPYLAQLGLAVATIRSITLQPMRAIIIGGPSFHNIFGILNPSFVPLADPNIIYTFHSYDPFALSEAGKWSSIKLPGVAGNEMTMWPDAGAAGPPQLLTNKTLAEMMVNFNAISAWAGGRPVFFGEFGCFSWFNDVGTAPAPAGFDAEREDYFRAIISEFKRLGYSWTFFDYHSDWRPIGQLNTFALMDQPAQNAHNIAILKAALDLPP